MKHRRPAAMLPEPVLIRVPHSYPEDKKRLNNRMVFSLYRFFYNAFQSTISIILNGTLMMDS